MLDDAVLKRLAAVVTFFGGLATLILVLGGVVLTVRLRSAGVPAEAVVSSIPTSFFTVIGLDVTLQLLVFGAFVAVGYAVRGRLEARAAAMLAAAAVVAYPFLRTADDRSDWILLVAAAVATAAVMAFACVRARQLVVVVAAVALFLAWRGTFEWLAVDVLDAKACVGAAGAVTGTYVGTSDKSVYLGASNHVVEIPRDQVKRLFVGDDLDGAACPG